MRVGGGVRDSNQHPLYRRSVPFLRQAGCPRAMTLTDLVGVRVVRVVVGAVGVLSLFQACAAELANHRCDQQHAHVTGCRVRVRLGVLDVSVQQRHERDATGVELLLNALVAIHHVPGGNAAGLEVRQRAVPAQ